MRPAGVACSALVPLQEKFEGGGGGGAGEALSVNWGTLSVSGGFPPFTAGGSPWASGTLLTPRYCTLRYPPLSGPVAVGPPRAQAGVTVGGTRIGLGSGLGSGVGPMCDSDLAHLKILTRHILTGRLAWGCPVEPVTCRAQTWIGGWEDHPVRDPVHGAGHSLGTLSVRYGPKPRHGEDHPVRDPVHAAGPPAVTLSVR